MLSNWSEHSVGRNTHTKAACGADAGADSNAKAADTRTDPGPNAGTYPSADTRTDPATAHTDTNPCMHVRG